MTENHGELSGDPPSRYVLIYEVHLRYQGKLRWNGIFYLRKSNKLMPLNGTYSKWAREPDSVLMNTERVNKTVEQIGRVHSGKPQQEK